MTDRSTDVASLLDALPHPAALLDDRGAVVVANAELRLAGARPGAKLFELFSDVPGASEVAERFRDGVLRGVLDDAVVVESDPVGDRADPVRVHMRSLPVGAGAFALVLLSPLPGDRTLERRIDGLEARLAAIGPVKHEIGGPLMGILGYADLLRQSVDGKEQIRQTEAILEQCRRIDTCLDALDRLRFGDRPDDPES